LTAAAVEPTTRGNLPRAVGRRLVDWLPAAIVLVLGIALWQGIVEGFHVQQFLLPRPSSVATTFWDDRAELWGAGWFTFQEALGGFALGSALGIAMAAVLARFRGLGDALMPVAIAANAIPIIAFSPIFNAWFDPLSLSPRIATAAVLCFFPVMVNTLRGLTSVRPSQIDLMRSYAAGELEIFRRVRVPTSLPFVFAALKVATVLAMIGAIVADYFGTFGSLGITIKNSVSLFDFETAWAAILTASILGVAMYVAVSLVERFALQWDPTRQERGTA
jgi:NitT/TauT family transport system permease protein